MAYFHRTDYIFFPVFLGLNILVFIVDIPATLFLRSHIVAVDTIFLGAWFAFMVAMAFFPQIGLYGPVICHGATNEKTVALTFDDGPDAGNTPLILDVLKKNGVKATFFCTGKNLSGHPSTARDIHEEGHLIGNHSYSHSVWFSLFSSKRIRKELQKTDWLVAEITGRTPLFFRPPFGVVNPLVSAALKHKHWVAVCWNIRSLDTVRENPENTAGRIIRKLKPGAIILLHDRTTFAGRHLGDLLARINAAGYRVVPLDELLNLPAYA